MAFSVPSLQRRSPIPWLDPIAVAAYAAWLAVFAGPGMELFTKGLHTAEAIAGFAAELAFITLFVIRGMTLGDRISLASQRIVVLGMLAAALVACWAFPDGMQAMLLVIVMPAMPAIFPWRVLVPLFVAVNLVLALLMFRIEVPTRWSQWLVPLQLMVAYVAFQVFTLLAIVSLRQANDARDLAQRVNAELLATRRLLEEAARSGERLRLSRELHDVAGHKLTALKMQLALQARETHSAALAQCEHLAHELLTDIRAVVSELRQHDGVELTAALRALDPGLPSVAVQFGIDPALRVADVQAAEALLRCAQEGLTNALRHGNPATVRITMQATPDGLQLEVHDDGAAGTGPIAPGNGLRGLQERLRAVGGTLAWSRVQPKGFRLRATLPGGR